MLKLGLRLDLFRSATVHVPYDMVQRAEDLGFHSVWTAEAYGADAMTPLAAIAAVTKRIKLGTAVVQLAGRPPAMLGMQAMTVDALAGGGRMIVGLGLSGPQIVEGWYGQPWGRPNARLRDYVTILRQVLRREGPVSYEGPELSLPYDGPGALGQGKALKSILHAPSDIPIWLASVGPRNTELCAELCEGWLPMGLPSEGTDDPEVAKALGQGFARRTDARNGDDFEIFTGLGVVITDDVQGWLDRQRPFRATYVGGMGSASHNYHVQAMAKRGYGEEAARIQELFLAGRRDEAIAAMPDGYMLEGTLIGSPARIREQWEQGTMVPPGVTGVIVGASRREELELIAELVGTPMPDGQLPEEWKATIADLEGRRVAGRSMGGEDRLAKHHGAGKLDARARVDALVDPGSFLELGTLTGGEEVPAEAIVLGSARVGGRPVIVAAEDFTVLAGTISHTSNSKRYRAAELAVRDRVPLVMMLDGAGFRADGKAYGRAPTDLLAQSRCSGHVPMITAVLGSSAGHGALVAPMSDFSVMSSHAAIFTAGPPVVLESLGETVTKEELGGPGVALASGLIHNVAPDDAAALELVRLYLSYFPSSAWSYPPDYVHDDTEPRPVPEILDIVPRDGRRVYDVRDVIDVVVDQSSWFEVQPDFGRSVVCALAHLGGHPVAVVANQPQVFAGSIDVDAADKAAHFITVADSFHLPLLFFADNPGVLPGTQSERRGILRAGARMFAAQTVATTPKFEVTLRKAYGFGSMVMGMIGFDNQSAVFAFPGATMGAMGAAAMSRARGSDVDESELLRQMELEASYRSAGMFGFDELIDPREIRNVLLHSLERALYQRQAPAEPVLRAAITP